MYGNSIQYDIIIYTLLHSTFIIKVKGNNYLAPQEPDVP